VLSVACVESCSGLSTRLVTQPLRSGPKNFRKSPAWMRRRINAGTLIDQELALVDVDEPGVWQIKQARGFRQFLLRGFEQVQGE
jgi:hypothetical protein